jgi:hypothetical protein
MTEPWTVVEGQNDFVIAQKVVGFEVLGAEARPPGRVDLDHPGDAQGVWIGADRCGKFWRYGRRRS